jgi:hypothetical protein
MSIVLIGPINILVHAKLKSGGQFPWHCAGILVVVDICWETLDSKISMIRHVYGEDWAFRSKHGKGQDGRCCVRSNSCFFVVPVRHEEWDHFETRNTKSPSTLDSFCWACVGMIGHKVLLNIVEMTVIADRDTLTHGST